MKLTGKVIDFYDDRFGTLLKEYFPTAESLPEVVKTAHVLSGEEQDVLRNEAYALVLTDGEMVFRKFACIDPGNTALSVLYFEKTAQALPAEAVAVAAKNLMAFCADFGIEPTPFVKMASAIAPAEKACHVNFEGDISKEGVGRGVGGIGRGWSLGKLSSTKVENPSSQVVIERKEPTLVCANGGREKTSSSMARTRDPLVRFTTSDKGKKNKEERAFEDGSNHWARDTNLLSIQGGTDSGRAVSTSLGKVASVIGRKIAAKGRDIKDAPRSTFDSNEITTRDPYPTEDPEVLGSTAAYTSTKLGSKRRTKKPTRKSDVTLEEHEKLNPNPQAVDGTEKISRIVDVSDKEPVPVLVTKKASAYALDGKYPLDSYTDVKSAVAYFKDNWTEMTPSQRHEFAVKTASMAETLGFDIPELLARYGSTEYAPDLEAHLATRRASCPEEFHGVYYALKEKKASIHPEIFAHLLAEADELAGLNWYWGGDISDPWMSTFGGETQREKRASWTWQGQDGTVVTASQLDDLARNPESMERTFQEDLVSAFRRDPVTIFESLPMDTQTLIGRLAARE